MERLEESLPLLAMALLAAVGAGLWLAGAGKTEPVNLSCPDPPACPQPPACPHPPDINLSCPAPASLQAPPCTATATCMPSFKWLQPCHVPDEYWDRETELFSLSGFSMHPAFFTGNTLHAVPVKKTDKLLEGCLYLYDDGEEGLVAHLLMGDYGDYAVFQGLANDASEEVDRNAVKWLVIMVSYT